MRRRLLLISLASAFALLGMSACAPARPRPGLALARVPPPADAPPYALVLGEVRSPGRVWIGAPTPLRDVIEGAGGLTRLACGQARVRRRAAGRVYVVSVGLWAVRERAREAEEIVIARGDEVFVTMCE